jgi:predicted aspartyl protease
MRQSLSLFFCLSISLAFSTMPFLVAPVVAAPTQKSASAAQASAMSAQVEQRSRAIGLYTAKDYAGAAQVLDQYLTQYKNDPYAAYYAAMANQQLGNNNKALYFYRQVYALSPNSQIGGYARNILAKLDPSFAAAHPAAAQQAPAASAGSASSGSDTPAFDPSLPSECRVHYEKQTSRIFLDTFIDGRQIKMMFDTGAPNTCVGKNQLAEIGAPLPTGPPAGNTTGSSSSETVPYWIVKADIKVGQIEKKNTELMVLETNSADPLLGQAFFQNFDCTIDQGAGEIVFRQKSAARAAIRNSVSVPFTFRKEGSRIIVQVTINGKTGSAMFDSGNTASACSFFNKGQLDKFGLKVPDDAVRGHHVGVNGTGSCLIFPVGRMQMGPIDRSNIEVSVNEGTEVDEDGLPLLGQPFWEGFEYTIDMNKKLIHFVRR